MANNPKKTKKNPYEIVSDVGKGIVTDASTAESEKKLETDAAYRASELDRAAQVILDRQAAGKDTSQQEIYIDKIKGLPTIETPKVTTEADDVRTQIAQASKDASVQRFKDQFAQTQKELEQTQAEGEQQFFEQRKQIGVEDTMAQAATDKRLAGLGLSGAGSAVQSDIARGVATRGALSSSRESEADFKQDIQNQLANAMLVRDQGIADANTEFEIAKLENQLAAIERAEAQKTSDEAQAKQDYLTTIGRFAQNYQAEIDKILNDGDPSNDWQVPYLQAARQEKIATENLDPTTGKPLETPVTYTVSQALEAIRQGLWNEQIATALGLPFNETSRQQVVGSTSGYTGGYTAPTTTPTTADDIVNNQRLVNDMAVLRDPIDQSQPMSALDKIREIQANYGDYVNDYGQSVIENFVLQLATQARLPGYEQQPNIVSMTPSQAQDLWAQLGTANESIAASLGIPVGSIYQTEAPVLSVGEEFAQSTPFSQARSEIINTSNEQDLIDLYNNMKSQTQLLIDAYGNSNYNTLMKDVVSKLQAIDSVKYANY